MLRNIFRKQYYITASVGRRFFVVVISSNYSPVQTRSSYILHHCILSENTSHHRARVVYSGRADQTQRRPGRWSSSTPPPSSSSSGTFSRSKTEIRNIKIKFGVKSRVEGEGHFHRNIGGRIYLVVAALKLFQDWVKVVESLIITRRSMSGR